MEAATTWVHAEGNHVAVNTANSTRKLLVSCLLLIVLSSVLFAQNTAAKRICLWEVADGGAKIHLLGSLHLMKADDYPLDGRFEEAFDGAEAVAFETDIGSLGTEEMQRYMLSRAVYTDGLTLQSELSEPALADLSDFLSRLGIPIEEVNGIRPWYLGLMFTALQMIQLGYDPTLGIDQHYYARSREAKKTVLELESAQFQIDLLASLADFDPELYLQQAMDDFNQVNEQLDQITAVWKAGDLDGMDILIHGVRAYPSLYEALIAERNRSWLTKIEGYLADGGNVLVIVGAGHLPGEDGLIHLLRGKGYRVSQY